MRLKDVGVLTSRLLLDHGWLTGGGSVWVVGQAGVGISWLYLLWLNLLLLLEDLLRLELLLLLRLELLLLRFELSCGGVRRFLVGGGGGLKDCCCRSWCCSWLLGSLSIIGRDNGSVSLLLLTTAADEQEGD